MNGQRSLIDLRYLALHLRMHASTLAEFTQVAETASDSRDGSV